MKARKKIEWFHSERVEVLLNLRNEPRNDSGISSSSSSRKKTLISLSMLWEHMRTAFPPIYVHRFWSHLQVSQSRPKKKNIERFFFSRFCCCCCACNDDESTFMYPAVVSLSKRGKIRIFFSTSPWLKPRKMEFIGFCFDVNYSHFSLLLSYVSKHRDADENDKKTFLRAEYRRIEFQPKNAKHGCLHK